MFRIELEAASRTGGGSRPSMGTIVAGDLSEEFEVSLVDWDEAAYRDSWCRELSRFVRGADKAVLLTVAMDPSRANWMRGYVLYKFGPEVRVQERMFILDELREQFNLSDPSASVGDYESVNEDGMRISQWVVPMRDIEQFWRQECQ